MTNNDKIRDEKQHKYHHCSGKIYKYEYPTGE